MNWDALGAVGEVVGAIAVVATLIYFSVQIRQNTRAVQIDRGGAASTKLGEIHAMIVTNNDLADLIVKCRNPSTGNLSSADEERVRRITNLYVLAYADIVRAYRLGLCDQNIYDAFCADLDRTLKDYPALKPYMSAIMEHFDLEAFPIFKPLFV